MLSSPAVLRLVDAMAILFSQAYQLARTRLASAASPVLRMMMQRDHALAEVELLQREIAILRGQRQDTLVYLSCRSDSGWIFPQAVGPANLSQNAANFHDTSTCEGHHKATRQAAIPYHRPWRPIRPRFPGNAQKSANSPYAKPRAGTVSQRKNGAGVSSVKTMVARDLAESVPTFHATAAG